MGFLPKCKSDPYETSQHDQSHNKGDISYDLWNVWHDKLSRQFTHHSGVIIIDRVAFGRCEIDSKRHTNPGIVSYLKLKLELSIWYFIGFYNAPSHRKLTFKQGSVMFYLATLLFIDMSCQWSEWFLVTFPYFNAYYHTTLSVSNLHLIILWCEKLSK